MITFKGEPGWFGAFTRHQAPGALPNGTRIVKAETEANDGHPDGTPGVIIGSLPMPPGPYKCDFMYFVEWAPRPRTAVATAGFKVREVRDDQ